MTTQGFEAIYMKEKHLQLGYLQDQPGHNALRRWNMIGQRNFLFRA